MSKRKTHKDRRTLLGLLLLVVGAILMVEFWNIAPIELPRYLISWKSFLILLGFVFLFSERNKATGTILIVIGGIFLAGDIFDLSFWEIGRYAIPLVLIIAGATILFRRYTYGSDEINTVEGSNTSDVINSVSIFGGGEKKITSQNFKGGQITAVFGGSELDFRQSKLSPGVNAIDMLCIFGGTSMRIPEGWHVKNEVNTIFGGFSDERSQPENKEELEEDKVLYLKGLVLFGGGEIK